MKMRSRDLAAAPFLILGVLWLLALSAAPALAAAPEEPLTKAAVVTSGTTATLHGELNPGAGAEKSAYHFAYSEGTGAGCSESGATAPSESPFPEAEGNHKEVSQAVTKLEASSEYSACLIAANPADEEESTQGNSVTFTTPASKPAIESESESAVTPFDATLEGAINPEKQETTYHLEYASNPSFTGATKLAFGIAGPGVSSTQTLGPVDIGGGLTSGTTYYYRVVAKNATGEAKGQTKEFTTSIAEAPKIEEESSPTVGPTTASLAALINPAYQATTCNRFEYGLTESYGSEAPCSPEELGAGASGEATGASLTGLVPNTEYHYQVLATNATGSSEGLIALGDKTFVTHPEPPTVSTGTATATASTALLTGTVNPGASGYSEQDDTTYHFEYGGTTTYGRQTPPVEVGEGVAEKSEEASLSGLEPGVSYHYRIVASNVNNAIEPQKPQITYGQDRTFPTTSTPPVLTGLAVSSITQNGATITATLDPQGLPTRYELQLGATAGLLQAQAAGNATIVTPLSLAVGSLSPGTTYYYKLVAINASDIASPASVQGSFTTGAPATPVLLGPPVPLSFPASPIPISSQPSPTIKKQTNAQKLVKALKTCKKDKKKHKRIACERAAHKRYPTSKHK